ncbi:MAG TPA: glycosyltransferase [Solirubrobacterales bacterium]|nr:glycosyltransferase [Solirubrobacterales bacterium]
MESPPTTTPKIQHLIETRFSLRTSRNPLTREWLDYRLGLLRKYTLPSVAAQTVSSFTWLLFCDESTDSEVLEQLHSEERRLSTFEVALTSGTSGPLDVVRSMVKPETDVLITTRLDSDDAIAARYVELIQTYAAPFHQSGHVRLLVNCPRGYRLDTREGPRLYRDWMPNSPFHSLFERPRQSEPETVLAAAHEGLRKRYADRQRLETLRTGHTGGHSRMHQHYPTHQDESMPAWLIVVHEGNMVNRIPPTAHEQAVGAQPTGITLGA